MGEGSGGRLGTLEFTLLMFSMTTCLPLFFLGPLAYGWGLSLTQAVAATIAGNMVTAIAMILNGLPGVHEGIDYTEQSRRVFGRLHQIPIALRGIVGGLWYGVEAFNGALAISLIILYALGVRDGIMDKAMVILPLTLAFYVATATLVYRVGITAVGKAASLAGPVLLVYFAYLAYSAKSISLSPSTLPSGVSWTSTVFLTYLAIQTNWWATVAVNMSDLTRAASSVKSTVVGVLLGVVGGQVLGTLLGYMLAVGSQVALPQEIILNKSPNALLVTLGLLFAFLAPWTTDLAANIPALDALIRGLFKLPVGRAAVIAGAIGFILAPWYAMDKAQEIVNYVASFTSSYGVLLGPVLGSMLAHQAYKKASGGFTLLGLVFGVASSYAYAYLTGTTVYYDISGVNVPIPPGITIYVGFAASLLASIIAAAAWSKTSTRLSRPARA